MHDFLMSSYAIFSLKYPSLLRFDQQSREDVGHNIKALFDIEHLPSYTHLRDIMDEVNPKHLRKIFTSLFAELQKTKVLANYELTAVKGVPHYLCLLMALDISAPARSSATSAFVTTKKRGRPRSCALGTMCLQPRCAPDQREVFSFCPGPIMVQDGVDKNDCEINAFKRSIADLGREHPRPAVIFTLDALYANTPVLELLKAHKVPYLITVKENMDLLMSQIKEERHKGQLGSLVEVELRGEKIIKKPESVYIFSNELRLFKLREPPK